MDQSLKQLFLQTTSPNGAIRNNAESQLKSLEKNTEFLNYIRNVLMKDQDKIIQQISSIYYMNTIERNWKAPELKNVTTDLEDSILNLLLIEDKYPKLAYQKILQCVFNNSEKETILNIFRDSANFLSSTDLNKNKAALVLFEEVFRSEALRFNLEDILGVMFNKMGSIFTSRFTEYISTRKFALASICMKVIAKAYSHYTLPDFLNSLEVFSGYFQLAIQILNTKCEKDDGFLRLQKWAAFFLYKSTNKGLKKYFKNNDFVQFIRTDSTLELLYSTFSKLLNDYISGVSVHERGPIICADFFSLFAGNKRAKSFIKNNYMFLISSFILPSQSYSGDLKDNFEDNAEAYLRERYNYYNSDLRSATAELFEEILYSDKEVEMNVVSSMREFLDVGINESNAPMRFGVIGLLANTQKSLIKNLSGEEFHQFLVRYIFPDLSSPHLFLISQALYFLSLMESIEILDSQVYDALSKIFSLTNNENDILSVESCLALNAFFYNESLRNLFKPSIPSLFEKILFYTKKYFLESLSTLCDSIIDCFTEDITEYAPHFIQTICSSFMDHIESENEEKLNAISGCLNTIQKLVMTAEDKPEIVSSIYQYASRIVYYVFENQKTEFFQECFDLMNSFLYVLRSINENMFEIFILSLSSDKDEICLYPREICDYIDNFLTYGGERMITPKTLELIYNCIDIFMPINSSECDVYDEDFEAACRIIDSVMLNAGCAAHQLNQNLIPAIIHKLISNYEFANTYEALPIYALDSITNCFIVSPEVTLMNLGTFTETFFSELDVHKKKFIRVYDKKLLLLFMGTLFKINANISINYEVFCDLFVYVVTTLPEAIKKRNKLKQQEENADEELDGDYSDYSAEDIYEDIYFETVLDKFDAYEFTRGVLSTISPNTIGEKTVAAMSSSHIAQIKEVLEMPQEIQK
ncbi:uncharacterized protein VICG_00028 [Vittaforma corneae ATCC 50505]|uniref:Importin N-terminal domain-containing protein n=1 Tax=Vittaforma corneae (strain ATCC 50505) TaxID=993615 RepID=L2GPA0_VITCO|nr:uncharacterized protein VICG_00028 [Vittaforma corneae ATCC 50505]ELA42713.1 hypothetical protein VICG_00028 [Vittaforma corneae ATCC 50505]